MPQTITVLTPDDIAGITNRLDVVAITERLDIQKAKLKGQRERLDKQDEMLRVQGNAIHEIADRLAALEGGKQ